MAHRAPSRREDSCQIREPFWLVKGDRTVRNQRKKSRLSMGYHVIDPATDPFTDTVLDYAYNLAGIRRADDT